MSMGRIRQDGRAFTILLGLLAALPALSIDISIPASLSIQQDFGALSRLVGLTITLFMIGFATGQFCAGPLSDRLGRRPVLLGGLTIYVLAAIACVAATDVQQLIGCRLLQGCGAGCSAVLAFAMIRDLFDGEAARSKRSYVTVVFSIAPMLAPSIGALILQGAGWRPIFLLQALAGGALLLIATLFIAESCPPRQGGTRHRFGAAYRIVLSNRSFVRLAAVNALSYGAMFAYIAGSSFVLMGTLQLSAQSYGAFFAFTAASLTCGAWVSGRCVRAGIGASRLMWVGLSTAAGSALLMSGLLLSQHSHVVFLLPLLLVNLFCRGVISPTAQHLALEPMRDCAGTAAGTVGVVQILGGALSSALVASLLPRHGPVGMTLVMAGFASLALIVWAVQAFLTAQQIEAVEVPCN